MERDLGEGGDKERRKVKKGNDFLEKMKKNSNRNSKFKFLFEFFEI